MASGSRPRRFANSSLVTTKRAGAVVDAGRVAGRRRPLGIEDGLQRSELLDRGVTPRALVRVEVTDRDDLVLEATLVDRLHRALVRAERPLVLRLARDSELARDERRLLDHVTLVEGGDEPVVGHQVDERAVAEPVTEARLLEHVRRVRHRLHATRDDDVVIAGSNHLVGDLHGADRRRADLVDRVRRNLDRQAGPDRRLASRSLARAALQDLAHDHVLDLVRLEADAVEDVPNHMRAELGRLVVLEAATELPKRGPDGGDDDRARHESSVTMR